MTPRERARVIDLVKAANRMARRDPGATAEWREVLVEVAPKLFGRSTVQKLLAGSSSRELVLGAREGGSVDRANYQRIEMKARLTIEVAELENHGLKRPRSTKRMEERALKLMSKETSELREMRDALREEHADVLALRDDLRDVGLLA